MKEAFPANWTIISLVLVAAAAISAALPAARGGEPEATADPAAITVRADSRHVLAARVAGEWQLDGTRTKLLGGRPWARTVNFRDDPSVASNWPVTARTAAPDRVDLAGLVTVDGEERLFLADRQGTRSRFLTCLRAETGGGEEDIQTLQARLAAPGGEEREKDLLFLGPDMGRGEFAVFHRANRSGGGGIADGGGSSSAVLGEPPTLDGRLYRLPRRRANPRVTDEAYEILAGISRLGPSWELEVEHHAFPFASRTRRLRLDGLAYNERNRQSRVGNTPYPPRVATEETLPDYSLCTETLLARKFERVTVAFRREDRVELELAGRGGEAGARSRLLVDWRHKVVISRTDETPGQEPVRWIFEDFAAGDRPLPRRVWVVQGNLVIGLLTIEGQRTNTETP